MAVMFGVFLYWINVIVAGHKADTVCVGNPGMHSYHLCLQGISHDLVAAQSNVFAKPQNKIFLISPHWLSCTLR